MKGVKGKKEAKELCEEFMKNICEEKYDEGFGVIEPYFPSTEKVFTNLREQIKQQMPMVKQNFGKCLGPVLVKEEEIKDLFFRFSFVQKFQVSIIRWVFIFYKPEKEWLLNLINYDEKKEELF
uniref:Uncharacterized protein n=1 Tax=uncultured marine group II/III euryarchaeote KM3_195_B08 TaxID=1457970 RepID=A0A075GWW7_9EURY|nr:hypothetical protein [uncultured marine group II/III euryarchaeote KM3_195_B08]